MGKKKQIFLIVLIGIILSNISFYFALASDDDNDGIDDEFEKLNKRDIEIEIEADKVQIQSFLRTGDQKDEIQFKIINDSEGLSIEVSYESALISENTTEFELEFGIIFRKLIEFVDINDNDIYDPSIDDPIQEFNLVNFQPVRYTQIAISSDTILHHFVINTTNGVFTAHIYLAEEFYVENETLITPIQSKIDLEISDFQYMNESSQLALYTSLDSENEYEVEEDTEDELRDYGSNERGVVTEMNNFSGVFTWKNNATIDGISKRVLTSDLDVDDYDGDNQKFYLTYSRGSYIRHDPKIGIAGIYKFSDIIDNPYMLIFLIALISSLTISIGYAVYHYRESVFTSHYSKLDVRRDLGQKVKFDSERINALFDNKKILHQLEELSSDKTSSLEGKKITALSEDFFKVIDLFDWEENDLAEFIREMISLTPEERKSIFDEMISKSEQQKKNRLDDTKRLYT